MKIHVKVTRCTEKLEKLPSAPKITPFSGHGAQAQGNNHGAPTQ